MTPLYALLNFVPPDLRPASAEIFVLAMTCLILILDLFSKDKTHSRTFALTQLTLLGGGLITVLMRSEQTLYTFSNMYVSDLMGTFLKCLVYLTVIVVLFYSRAYLLARPHMLRSEFYVLSLFATLGMLVMISANHFLLVYIGIELLSLSLYALVAFNRDSVTATEAAMKYFVLGALASGLLLYGMSMIYGATGTLDITELATRLRDASVSTNLIENKVLVFGVVFLVAGVAFKLGAAPFHMWIPDVYQGAPTAVTLFIASAPKLAAFAVVIRMLVEGLIAVSPDWQAMLMILSVVSMGVGNFAAIAQTNIKRMLAYSAIAHMGFMLLGLASGLGDNAELSLRAYSASMVYVVAYVLTSLGTFGMILLLTREGFESEEINDLAGLNKRSPWLAAMMMMMMFSMAGIPFFVGFIAKFSVFVAVIATGKLWLVLIAIFFSLVGAYYYLRVVKVMYFDAPTQTATIQTAWNVRLLISANGLLVALIGIFPESLIALCSLAIKQSQPFAHYFAP